MKKINKIFLLSILVSVLSCSIGIGELDKEVLSFEDLPKLVQNVFLNKSNYKDSNKGYKNFISLDSISIYDYKKEKTILPWIYDSFVVSKDKKITLGSNKFKPLIILDNTLYIPNDFNVFNGEKYLSSSFNSYDLRKR